MRYTINKIVSFIALALILMLVVNRAVYFHTHVLPDGTVVQHAHPYPLHEQKNGKAQHQHSSIEFLFFAQIMIFLIGFALFLSKALQNYHVRRISEKRKIPSPKTFDLPLLRAPPLFL
ncbi:MAG: hypothetical protein U9Q98_02440 [Bacteroidota bacterium]|nr:hypothetical protein [Bacteroidota bacterium]